MSTVAWIAVGVVAYFAAGAAVVGVILGLSPTEVTEDLDSDQLLRLVLIWPATVIVATVLLVATPVEQWRRWMKDGRDSKDAEAEDKS